jgi:hypothetical protein
VDRSVSFVRGFGLGDPALERIFAVDFVKVFHEDVVILEAQQRMNDLMPKAPRVNIAVDAAPLAARRMLDALIAAEKARVVV